MVVGGSIIIPIDISTDETTISITINGMYIKKPNIKAVLSSLSIKLFVDISGDEYDDYDDVPFTTLVPAFILSELR